MHYKKLNNFETNLEAITRRLFGLEFFIQGDNKILYADSTQKTMAFVATTPVRTKIVVSNQNIEQVIPTTANI